MIKNKESLTWIILWSCIFITSIIFLPGFSEFDATKYMTVSHDMMQQHNYLRAYWQGHLYSDKPPLFFWLIISGWKLFGVSKWWLQFIVLAIATASIVSTKLLAKVLWPQEKSLQQITPLIMVGCFYWIWFAKQIRVDSILVLATILSAYSIIKIMQNNKKYWLLYILSIGLGGFSKGPVILIFILLPTIIVALINKNISKKWFFLLGIATITGVCIPLTWAIPAAIIGGKTFMHEIFYDQIAHRVHQHNESIFFYIVHLPLWLLPWSAYPPVWTNIRALKISNSEIFCLSIIGCGLIAFSIFGEKLAHYIYPLFPFFSLLIARLCTYSEKYNYKYQWPLAVVITILALFCLLYPNINNLLPEKAFIRGYALNEINLIIWGSVFSLTAIILIFCDTKSKVSQIILIATTTVLMALFVNNSLLASYIPHINNKKIISLIEKTSRPLAATGEFTDDEIMKIIKNRHIPILNNNEIEKWLTQNPNSLIIHTDTKMLHANKKPIEWFYQSRYSIISIYGTT